MGSAWSRRRHTKGSAAFADERTNKNLLGRLGWLDRIRLGLIDHDAVLCVASYD